MFGKLLRVFALLSFIITAQAEDTQILELKIINHRFEPEILQAVAGKRIKLIVHNTDKTVEEFESYELKREKIIPGGKTVNIILPPLKPGKYNFFGEFHEDTAQGYLVVK